MLWCLWCVISTVFSCLSQNLQFNILLKMLLSKEDTRMENKDIKRCYTSYVTREMQIKTIVRHHYTCIRIAKLQSTENTKCWRGCGAAGSLVHCWWECKMVRPLWKTVWQFLTKLNIPLPYDPAITLLGIHPNELKTYVHTKTRTWMFIAALFITVETWKQPRCPSVDEWIHCGTSRHWNIIQCSKAISYQSMKTHGGHLNAYY